MSSTDQNASAPVAEDASHLPLVGINIVDGKVLISIKDGVEVWQAIGAIEVASKILRDYYK